jgi:hypothetical protein
MRPVEAEPGDILLFAPLHLHCAQVVDGDETRISIDVRIAPRRPRIEAAP